MDISKEENCYQLYKEYKDINVLINDAGLRDCGYFYQTSLEKDIQMIHTNIIGLHVLTKLYLQDMKEKIMEQFSMSPLLVDLCLVLLWPHIMPKKLMSLGYQKL